MRDGPAGADSSVELEFRGHRVRVLAERRRVVERVRQSFSHLLASDTGAAPNEVLEVRGADGEHELRLDGDLLLRDPSLQEVQRGVRHEVIRAFIRAHPDLFWLHAGAVLRDGRALLFVGHYGRGKSTLVARLCVDGWRYLSDDVVPLDLATGRLIPFPLTPIVRAPVDVALPADRLAELSRLKVRLPEASLARDPAPIGGIVLPRFETGAGAQAESFSASFVALDVVRQGINREDHGLASVRLFTHLVGRVPVLPLAFDDVDAAAALIERTMVVADEGEPLARSA